MPGQRVTSARFSSSFIANFEVESASMLQNKVAVITGAASDIQAGRLGKLAEELGGPSTAVGRECDVGEEGDVEVLVGAAVQSFGRLDIMVANAGIAGKNMCPEAMTVNLDTEEFDRQIRVNLRGVALCIKHAGRAMQACGSKGCIINTASVAGLIANCSSAGDPAIISAGYGASKAGVIALTRIAACELCEGGIRVNAVAPGFVATPMVDEVLRLSPEKSRDQLAETSPLPGVAIMPSDIANAMLYLASDMGRCVNGHTLVVDSGLAVGVAGYAYRSGEAAGTTPAAGQAPA